MKISINREKSRFVNIRASFGSASVLIAIAIYFSAIFAIASDSYSKTEKNIAAKNQFQVLASDIKTHATKIDSSDQLTKKFHQTDPMERVARNAEAMHLFTHLPTQANGRVKPLHTLANESIELITGKTKFKSLNAMEFFLSVLFEPQYWRKQEFIKLEHRALKRDIDLQFKNKYFSFDSLYNNPKVNPLFQELNAKVEAEEKLDPYFQAVQTLQHQLQTISMLMSGHLLRLVPPSLGSAESTWIDLTHMSTDKKLQFMRVATSYVNDYDQTALLGHLQKFQSMAKANNPQLYSQNKWISLEVHYNKFRPFRWSWILALIGSIVLGVSLVKTNNFIFRSGLALYLLSFAMQIYGIALRCIIAGRPPVTNMYESVLWVAFACSLFGLVFEFIYRKKVILLGALIYSVLLLIMADNLPSILDDAIDPLEAVLRSNLWLIVHVMTITLGYGAFALSLILANMALAPIVFLGRVSKLFPLKNMAHYCYRAVQVGVVLLAAGTILGGVWADYSWGRFWGWDPKETWALIALLGYLAIIHARFNGMLRSFGFLASCICAFSGVLMAWYGVNFVLGAGLHSYGFSSGGLAEFTAYSIIQFLYVFYAIYAFQSQKHSIKKEQGLGLDFYWKRFYKSIKARLVTNN